MSGPTVSDFAAPASAKPVDLTPPPSASATQSIYAKQLQAVPELESYGPVLRSSGKPVELTESETEYVVNAVKHVFKEHVVFQVSIFSRMLFTDNDTYTHPLMTLSSTSPTRYQIPF